MEARHRSLKRRGVIIKFLITSLRNNKRAGISIPALFAIWVWKNRINNGFMRFPLAERMGFEPMCDCSQTDFESCSHLVLSCLLWSVAAVLETAKTLVLQRISDAPTGIDQLHIRKSQSSNWNEKCPKTIDFFVRWQENTQEENPYPVWLCGQFPRMKCKKNRLKTDYTKHPFGPKHRKESSL